MEYSRLDVVDVMMKEHPHAGVNPEPAPGPAGVPGPADDPAGAAMDDHPWSQQPGGRGDVIPPGSVA